MKNFWLLPLLHVVAGMFWGLVVEGGHVTIHQSWRSGLLFFAGMVGVIFFNQLIGRLSNRIAYADKAAKEYARGFDDGVEHARKEMRL